MKSRLIPIAYLLGLALTGCVIETRHGSRSANNAEPPPPPPPPAGTVVAPPPTEAPPAVPVLPPPTGVRDQMRSAPLPPPAPGDPAVPASTKPLPAQPPPDPPPAPPPKPLVTLTGVGEGAPTIAVNSPPAYWIWHDGNGVWKVRTTDGNTLQKFGGRFNIRTGNMSALRITRIELERRVDVKGQNISFSYATNGQTEGLDFTVEQPKSCLLVMLATAPNKKIFLGGRQVQPPDHDFILCPPK